MNFLFCKFTGKQWVSRAKTLLKRRKKAIKNRPISAKRLKQQTKLFNYAKQYKTLQIQKQLDKRRYASQHINELMDQIFYPDITLANEQAMKIQIQTSTLKQYSKGSINADPIQNLINKNAVATQLIEIYNKNQQQFQPKNFLQLFSKLRNYFNKRDQIKQNVENKWKKMNQNMKKNDPSYKQKKCPYLFIDKDDTVHYQPWNLMLESVLAHFQKLLSSEKREQNLFIFLRVLQQLNFAVGYVPYQYYQMFDKHLCTLKKQQISQFPLKYCKQLLKCAGLKNKVRYSAYSKINQPQIQKISQSNQNKMLLVTRMLTDPQSTYQNFLEVIKAIRNGVIMLNQNVLQMLKPAILSNLANLPFERVTDLLIMHLKQNIMTNLQLLELLKFDALRKCPNAYEKKSLLVCMQLVVKKKLQFQKGRREITINGKDLFYACASVICSRYCGSNTLSYTQVIKLINLFYSNQLTDINLLQLIASELVKVRHQTSLSELTSCVFKLFILGYNSPVMSTLLFQEYKNKYHETLKRIKNEEIKYLSGQIQPSKQQVDERELERLPAAQLALQQDLIICLWLLFRSRENQSKPPLSLDQLIKVYPTSIQSRHSLIYEMCLNLNKWSKDLSILLQISCSPPVKRKTNNIQHRLNRYYQYQNTNQIAKVMKLQAVDSNLFVDNYNLSSLDARKFVPEIWSENYCYSTDQYLKEMVRDPNKNNFFKREERVSQEIKNKRIQMITKFNEQEKKNTNAEKNTKNKEQKYYQID